MVINWFGANAAALLGAKRLRQNAVAAAIGINPPELSDWLNPRKPNRRIALLSALKLAAGLDCSIEALVIGGSANYDACVSHHRRRLDDRLARVPEDVRVAIEEELAFFTGGVARHIPPIAASEDLPVKPSSATHTWLVSVVRSIRSLDALLLLQTILASEIQTRAAADEERPASGL